MAASVDFFLGPAKVDKERLHMIRASDQMKLALRHFSAHMYEARTKDKAGAMKIRAPGSGVDIAPGWLVNEVTVYSKAEHQRSERVLAEARRRTKGGKGEGKSKTGGKGESRPE